MLTGRQLVFVGGDARQLEVIASVITLDASVTLIGFEKAQETLRDIHFSQLTEEALQTADALILPMAGTDDEGAVASQFSREEMRLTERHFEAMPTGSFVFTGIARPYLADQCRRFNLQLVPLMELDEVAILNSIPTAEGSIMLAMENTDITLHGSNCMVLGFGRCGQTLARTLAAMGAKVKVGARSEAHLARVVEMGLTPVSLANLQGEIKEEDVIFNTIPYLVLTASVLREAKDSAVVIDIASKPGGTDFGYAERRRLKAILAPSLPGLVAPKTAGQIIARTLTRLLTQGAQQEV